MRIVKFLLPLLIVAAGVGMFRWLTVTAEPPEPLRPEVRAPAVSVRMAEKVTASPTLRIFGQVEAPTLSVLTAAVEADVLEVAVLEGDAVRRGQQLVVLDDVDAALELRQRRAELADIEAQLESDRIKLQSDTSALKTEQSLLALQHKAVERAAQLARSKAGSEAALDQARQDEERQRLAVIQRRQSIDDFPARRRQLQARRDRAEAALRRAERARERTRVAAPFSGRITEVMVSEGERVNLGGQLLQLYDESQLELRAQVPSSYLPALQQALAAGRTVSAVVLDRERLGRGREPVELALHRLSAQVAAGRGGIDAFFRARRGRLPVPGGTLEINLRLPPLDNVVLVSPDSLYGRERIYLVRGEVLQSNPVRRLGRISDGRSEPLLIVDGADFEEGDLILDSRLPQAINGLKVQVAR